METTEFKDLKKIANDERLKYNEKMKPAAFAGFGVIGGLGSLLGYHVAADNAYDDEGTINRSIVSKNYFDKDIDPRLKNLYLQGGSHGLQRRAGDILQEIIPPSTSAFVPADLSLAGKYKETLENIAPINYPKDNITVTPGFNPARFAIPELTPNEIEEGGAKGYIWGNPDEPVWSYAQGNYNKNPSTTTNPTLYMTKLDLPPENKGYFRTTGEVETDPTLIENRQWGQRNGGDLFFPKESIKARGEVTAMDLYTKIKSYGFEPEPINVNNPALSFEKLAKRLATIEGTPGSPMPIKQMLENIATPVPALGISERERGAIPVYKGFDPVNATLEQKTKAGINKVFIDPTNLDSSARVSIYDKQLQQQQNTKLAIPYDLKNPSTYAGRSFKNVNPLTSGGFLAGALYSPEVFEDLEKKRYGSAIAKAGSAAAAGTIMEGIVRSGVVNAAKAGITLPARALAYANPAVAAVSMATLAPGSSRITPRQEAYENQLRETKFKQAEAARKRGGKWKFPTPFGQVTIPEFGMSEAGGLFFR